MKRILITLIAAATLAAPVASAQVLPFPIGGLYPAPLAGSAGPANNSLQVGVQANQQFGEGNTAGNRVLAGQSASSSHVGYPYFPIRSDVFEEEPLSYAMTPVVPSYASAHNTTTVGAQLNLQTGFHNRAQNLVQSEQRAEAVTFPFGASMATNATTVGAQLNLQNGGSNTATNEVISQQSATSASGSSSFLPWIPQ